MYSIILFELCTTSIIIITNQYKLLLAYFNLKDQPLIILLKYPKPLQHEHIKVIISFELVKLIIF